jgi:hypothetical protein
LTNITATGKQLTNAKMKNIVINVLIDVAEENAEKRYERKSVRRNRR